jgi:hypothetical protein
MSHNVVRVDEGAAIGCDCGFLRGLKTGVLHVGQLVDFQHRAPTEIDTRPVGSHLKLTLGAAPASAWRLRIALSRWRSFFRMCPRTSSKR